MGRTIGRIDRKLITSLSKKQLSLLEGSSDVKDMGKDALEIQIDWDQPYSANRDVEKVILVKDIAIVKKEATISTVRVRVPK